MELLFENKITCSFENDYVHKQNKGNNNLPYIAFC